MWNHHSRTGKKSGPDTSKVVTQEQNLIKVRCKMATLKLLTNLCIRINTEVGNDGKKPIDVGMFYIERAYGGHKLVQTMTEGYGIRNVFSSGYISKKRLCDLMYAFLEGLYYAKEHDLKSKSK